MSQRAGASLSFPSDPDEVLSRVNGLVSVLRSRAAETEQLRHMHPDNLRELTEAGVFRLMMPTAVGGYRADHAVVAEVLAQIARGCPSTSWMCTIMVISNQLPALLSDEAAEAIYATPDLRMTQTIAATGEAVPVEGGYRVTGCWKWNTGGVHSHWIAPICRVEDETTTDTVLAVIPASEAEHQDTWRAAGMAGTATNSVRITNVFVPATRAISAKCLAAGTYPSRQYSSDPYFNRPWVMSSIVFSAPTFVGIARGAMDVFMDHLSTRGPITFTGWSKAAEAPILHHQLATAQLALEAAELFTMRLHSLLQNSVSYGLSINERVQARAWLGHVATEARACVNQLFEASGASQSLLSADLQRYFRDVNVLHQHAGIQPNSTREVYGRLLAGQAVDTELL